MLMCSCVTSTASRATHSSCPVLQPCCSHRLFPTQRATLHLQPLQVNCVAEEQLCREHFSQHCCPAPQPCFTHHCNPRPHLPEQGSTVLLRSSCVTCESAQCGHAAVLTAAFNPLCNPPCAERRLIMLLRSSCAASTSSRATHTTCRVAQYSLLCPLLNANQFATLSVMSAG